MVLNMLSMSVGALEGGVQGICSEDLVVEYARETKGEGVEMVEGHVDAIVIVGWSAAFKGEVISTR